METVLKLPKDLKDVEDSSFDLLPDSVYRFKVIGGQVKRKSPNDAPYIEWDCACQDPNHPKAKVVERTSSSESSLWRIRKFLKALGEKEPTGTDVDSKKYVGREFMGETIQEPYEYQKDGETKKGKSNKFADYFSIPGAAPIATTQAAPAQVTKPAQVAEEVPF